jgi:hypothetical protein
MSGVGDRPRERHVTVADYPKLTGRGYLTPDNMPRMILFSDVADEKSARVLTMKASHYID